MAVRLRGWLVTPEAEEDVRHRAAGTLERCEQAAARAVVHLEKWFDHPDPRELSAALQDLQEALGSTG